MTKQPPAGPQPREYEEAFLGCIMLDPSLMLSLGVPPGLFSTDEHQATYDALSDFLHHSNGHYDHLLFASYLEQHGLIDKVGGIAQVTSLVEKAGSVEGAPHYLKRMSQAAVKRRLQSIASRLYEDAVGSDEAEVLVARLQQELEPLAKGRVGPQPGGKKIPTSAKAADLRLALGLTDQDNARRLQARLDGTARWVPERGSWVICKDGLWSWATRDAMYPYAVDVTAAIAEEGAKQQDTMRRGLLCAHAVQSRSAQGLKNMIDLTRGLDGITARINEFDANPWLLAVKNGVLNLKTGSLRPRKPTDMLINHIDTHYTPQAKCDAFLTFLDQIMLGRADMCEFLQRAIGYSLTGDVSEQVIFFLFGCGRNGKSTLKEILLSLVGPYGREAAPGLLLQRHSGQQDHPTSIADLHGRRVVSTVEVEEGRPLAEALIKQLTGGDRLTARFMRQDLFDFYPTHKLWLLANHKPTVRGQDAAIWRRILLIPFDLQVPEHQVDRNLLEKLKGELPGILKWAVNGCIEWRLHGLRVPDLVRGETLAYRSEQDVIGLFLEDTCYLDQNVTVTASALYAAYVQWGETYGEKAWSQRAFISRLLERGFKQQRTNSCRLWRGLSLKSRMAPVADVHWEAKKPVPLYVED